MIKAILSDFSRVVLFPKDDLYEGSLNKMHEQKSSEKSYIFWDYYRVNEELLTYYKSLVNKYHIYCFTTGRIQEYPELKDRIKDVFVRIFTVEDLKLQKNDPQSYSEILKELNLTPEEVLFIDDTQENLEAANKAGLRILQYSSNDKLIDFINNISE